MAQFTSHAHYHQAGTLRAEPMCPSLLGPSLVEAACH